MVDERADGSTLRDATALLDALAVLCPFVELVRLGFYVLPLRGPSRFFGGDEAVFAAVRASAHDVLGVEVSLGVAEGLFCAEMAARRGVVLAAGETTAFRRRLALDTLGHRDIFSKSDAIHMVLLVVEGGPVTLKVVEDAVNSRVPVVVRGRVAYGGTGGSGWGTRV